MIAYLLFTIAPLTESRGNFSFARLFMPSSLHALVLFSPIPIPNSAFVDLLSIEAGLFISLAQSALEVILVSVFQH
jgi:hypothetical protein